MLFLLAFWLFIPSCHCSSLHPWAELEWTQCLESLGAGSAQVWGTTVKFFTLLKLSYLDEVLLTEERGLQDA